MTWLWSIRREIAATAAFCAVTGGLWLERPSLALIVPGLMVFIALVYTHLRGA